MSDIQQLEQMLATHPNEGTVYHRDASEEELEMLSAMEGHFGGQDYVLPVKEEATETAGLNEREMMFLVSSHNHHLQCSKTYTQSRETFMRYVFVCASCHQSLTSHAQLSQGYVVMVP